MTDEELVARLRRRARDDRAIQKNNETVAAALMGQRILFDQGIRSEANSFAVRLAVEHENCAKNDAQLARDWDAAADRIEALVERLTAAGRDAHEAEALANEALARAERLEAALRAWTETIATVMPKDFKDWHQNSPDEWPLVTVGVIKSLQEQLDLFLDQSLALQARDKARVTGGRTVTDLTKITTPFGLLDKDTQDALRAHGWPYEWLFSEGGKAVWMDDGDPDDTFTCCPHLTIRVKPQPVSDAALKGADHE